MKQNSTTILVPVIPDHVQDLLDELASVKRKSKAGISEVLGSLSIIHYARWVVIDHDKSWINDDKKREPKLLFVVDFDGNKDNMIEKVCEKCSIILDLIYVFCKEYPPLNTVTQESRVAYFKKYIIKDTAVYIGAPGRSVIQIQQEKSLRNYIRDFLDSRSWIEVPAQTVFEAIKSQVSSTPKFDFLKTEQIAMPKINYPVLTLVGLLALILLPIWLPILIVWILILHFFYENKDENFTKKRSQLDDYFLSDLEKYEDFQNQNQFTQLVDMKNGNVRLLSIKFMFMLTNFLIKMVFNQGNLMGIPTIHFAKWVMFENNSRVLFFSNFDGSWQQYLGDFIDNSGWGLTGIFSNTMVFPKTNFLITGGAYNEEYFLAWSRNSELVTNFWYSAYPDLSIKNVNNNTMIRVQLMKTLSERQAAKFLKLL